jgi:nanoRNase/pAp phosphatase (c-di-AMP/oligoRNAs hydrolase)
MIKASAMSTTFSTRARMAARSVVRRPRIGLLARNSVDARRAKLDRLVEYARSHKRALVLTHDNPDPDALGSAVALAFLLEQLAGVRTAVAYGGIVGRAENRALIRTLKLPVVPISRIVFDDYDLICMVDTQPEQGNHSLPPRFFPDVVIDHHPERPDSKQAPVADIGGGSGSTSTLLASYLRVSGLEIPTQVATVLFYGIKADTRDLGRETETTDIEAYLWLFPMVDKQALTEIEHPRLPIEYFRLFHTAIEKAVVYDASVVCDLGEIYSPDVIAEMAERFLYLCEVKWSLAYAVYEDDLYFSLRTRDRRMNAGRLMREIIEERGGSAGGHGSMAGARVSLRGIGSAGRAEIKQEIVERFLTAFGAKQKPPRKIV